MFIISIKTGLAAISLFIFIQLTAFSQHVILSGFVRDKNSGEKLIGVSVYDQLRMNGAYTNNYGYFSLAVPVGDTVMLSCSYTGYSKQVIRINPTSNMVINFEIEQKNEIKEVEVKANKIDRIERQNQMSVIQIPMKELKSIPILMGEADLMRAFQLMPGVQSGTEGTSGLYVRGGSPDQNLILLDEIPLYYVNHIGGFISVFDPNAISNVKLYKGGFPARYGGKLSSVIDIRMKDGNLYKRHGEYTMGIISSKISYEFPLIKEKSSMLISVRRCNLDLFSRLMTGMQSGWQYGAGYTFYDINSKINHKISEKDRLLFSFYAGDDKIFMNQKQSEGAASSYESKDKSRIKWGNMLASLRWNHVYRSNLFGNLTTAFTRFRYLTDYDYKRTIKGSNKEVENMQASFLSGVTDLIAKYDFDYFLNKHQIKFGASATLHLFNPGETKIFQQSENSGGIDTLYGAQKLRAIDYSMYVEDEIEFNPRFSANVGFHAALYHVEKSNFASVQPRLSLKYMLKENIALKLSYASMMQTIHLLSNTNAGLPTDLWLPATTKVKPELSQQVAVGIAHTINNRNIEISIESYYKKMKRLIEYKEGTIIISDATDWQNKVETDGQGEAYGAEFMIRKTEGKTTGWIGYTIAKNSRKFDNLNGGLTFPYKYDRRHDVSIVINHTFNEKISISAVWVYATGDAITLAMERYPAISFDYGDYANSFQYTFKDAHYYGGKNQFRMSAYHRLDLGINFTKKKLKGIRIWNLSVYNVYNNKNTYFLYYNTDKDNNRKIYKFCLFPIIPSFSYSYQF
jgi:hypothetical protein